MNATTSRTTPLLRRLVGEWLTIVMIALAVAFAVGATNYRGQSVDFPLGVGTLMAALGVAELIRRLRAGRKGSPVRTAEEIAERNALYRAEAVCTVWLIGSVLVCYFLGLLAGIAIGTATYGVIVMQAGAGRSAMWGLFFAALIWFGLDFLAGFQLHPGLVW